ncbi:hypothetical protein WN53_00160 [Serratia fonticola]|uniref:DUF4225 domain-containing protein n=1 Tax=Serratia fonticola TaxID=47917 RepID=UPI0003F4BED4|nr:DUF4225 domain-containing protein [Serratia fonticola]AKG67678.1 hypothetical protein WN53_00160 [Serratia fonticola]CAI1818360.1 Uncharacterised protein [Serratia fonticola]
MGTAAIAHLKYDLDRHAVDLRRIATLASAYFIENYQIRREYLREVDDFISDINRRFKSTFDINGRMRLIIEVRTESEITQREYQILRQGSYTKYIVTEIFEDQGVVKYAKIGGGVFSGLIQTYMGWTINKLGQTMHFRHMKSIGVILIANGTNNTFESISPVLFENQRVGWVRKLYRLGAEYLGGDKYDGDFAYGTVDFIATLYSAYRMPVITQNKNRYVTPFLFEKPGTGRLFRYVNKDYVPKWINASNAMRIYQLGSTAHKFSLLYGGEGYKYQEN